MGISNKDEINLFGQGFLLSCDDEEIVEEYDKHLGRLAGVEE